MKTGFIDCKIVAVGADSERYHQDPAQRGSPEFAMGQGSLIEFAKCPRRWVRGYESPPSEAKDWGSMVDCMLLTPDEWGNHYAVCPETYRAKDGEVKPWRNDKRIKEVADWLEVNEGKQHIKAATVDQVKAAVARISEDRDISSLLAESDRQVWLAGFYGDLATRITVPVKALVDIAPKAGSFVWGDWLGDLKTTRGGHPDIWKRWVFDRKYHVQAAFYLDLYNAATGEKRNKWFHVLQENFPPFEIGKRILSERFIGLGRALYQSMLAKYCRCLKDGVWPGYDDGWGTVEPEPWMETQAILSTGNLPGDPGDDSDLDAIAPTEPAQAEAA